MTEIFKIAWRNLFRNPRRTAASLLTVCLGAAALLIYQGFNSGIMNQYRENTIHGYYGFGQVFPKGYYGKVFEQPWKMWIENPEEAERKLLSAPGVEQVFPRLSFYSFLAKGGITLGGRGEGVLPERENKFFDKMNFISGGDLKDESEIILGKGLADSLDVKAGDTLTLLTQTINGQLNGADLKVAGVFHMGIKAIDDGYYRLHLKQAQRLLDTQRVELFSLATTGVDHWDEVAKNINQADPNLEPVRFEILDKVYYQNSVDFLSAQFAFIRMIILLIVALGIFNTIAVGLLERGGEIGALRANGEKRSRLFKILLLENSFLGLFGGILGILLALLCTKTVLASGIPMPPGPGITRQYLIFIEIQGSHYVQALLLPMFTAIIASCWPIFKLLRRSIPELLRST
ncbi:ABC transporter permease [Bdellovibrio sp. HCB185ZH]|uniref:ABC transporter permease n=1 Tax=Bdellovibrio sp. HCB185ZH TaxID=3394235 RepID=UPI0039A730BE